LEDIIEPQLKAEIPHFEDFLNSIGFKRTDGSVFGLLVLAKRPLTSEEIAKELGLSQPAVSSSLKTLNLYGAIDTRDMKEGRAKTHSIREDSLSIVSSVFRKREQENIERFRLVAIRCLEQVGETEPTRARKLRSIMATCQIAEAVMNFVIGLSGRHNDVAYPHVVRALPKALDFISGLPVPSGETQEALAQLKNHISTGLAGKLRTGLSRLAGEGK
tara:strand:+ start:2790 stop:3440 length:651 start_codon:yes stop_codon:yes gene_type:complete